MCHAEPTGNKPSQADTLIVKTDSLQRPRLPSHGVNHEWHANEWRASDTYVQTIAGKSKQRLLTQSHYWSVSRAKSVTFCLRTTKNSCIAVKATPVSSHWTEVHEITFTSFPPLPTWPVQSIPHPRQLLAPSSFLRALLTSYLSVLPSTHSLNSDYRLILLNHSSDLLTNSFDDYLPSIYYVPSTVPSTRDTFIVQTSYWKLSITPIAHHIAPNSLAGTQGHL